MPPQGRRVIASVAFRNFKALRNTSLALMPFNLVIGPNGSGKTSLIEALMRLRTLSQLATAEPRAAPRKQGGPEIEFRFAPPHDGITVQLGCISESVCDELRVVPANAAGWGTLRQELGRFRSYALDHAVMGAPVSRTTGAELAPDGANLAAVLDALHRRAPEAFTALTAELLRILPEFRSIELAERADDRVELGLRLAEGELVAASELSQGMLYLLAVLALAFDPAPPRLLCIEEIDRGIHPRMLREVRDALYRLSHPESYQLARPPVQIVTTSHSPYFIDLFRDHAEEVVILQKRGRAARFERLADRPDLPELLSEGSLGDMWFSGILGGVPEEE
jgi:predicted ATPase